MVEKRNILIAHNYYRHPGGEDTVFLNESRMLANAGYRVVNYTRSTNEVKKPWQALLLPFTTLFSLRTYVDIKKIIRQDKIDIVHVHNTMPFISPSIYFAAWAMKVPVVQTLHNFRLVCPGQTMYRDGRICDECLHKGFLPAIRHSCFRSNPAQTMMLVAMLRLHRMLGTWKRVNCYICLTDFNKEKLSSYLPTARISVKPNFVFDYETEIPFAEREYEYIFAGRLDLTKGVWPLVKAFEKMPEKRILIVGDGPEKSGICSYIEQKHLENITLHGWADHETVLRLFANSKASVFPTLWYEGFPMTIIESFSTGTPVLCSNIGNANIVVEEGITGSKFAVGNPDDIVRVIRSTGDDKLEQMGINARRKQRTFYNEETNLAMLLDIYQTCINRDRG